MRRDMATFANWHLLGACHTRRPVPDILRRTVFRTTHAVINRACRIDRTGRNVGRPGRERIPAQTFAALCDILECTPNDLFEPCVQMRAAKTANARGPKTLGSRPAHRSHAGSASCPPDKDA
jgi:Cro/C1-type HTH DNA-binding domain